MQIKEVEQVTGVKSANIRYYESKGLINPVRKSNNYREYEEEDVEMLKKIKMMRMLGITVEDIYSIIKEKVRLEEVMTKRLEELEKEEQSIQESKKVCQSIKEQKLQVENLSDELFKGNEQHWQKELRRVRIQDTDKMFLVKGMLIMAIPLLFFALEVAFAGGYTPEKIVMDSMTKLYLGIGSFFLAEGLALAIYEGIKGYHLMWMMGVGTNWAPPGLGVFTNCFTISAVGLFFVLCALGPIYCLVIYILDGMLLCIIRLYFMYRDIHPVRGARGF